MAEYQYSINDKYALYNFLIQNGFDAFQKPELLASSVPGLDVSEIRALLESYKRNRNVDPSHTWTSNILSLRQHCKHEAFYDLMANVVAKKANNLQPNDPYREVYQFLAAVLKGEFPKEASLHTTMVVLLLMQDLSRITQSVKGEDLYACLTAEDGLQPGDSESEADTETREELKKRLMSLFKFKRVNEFINPLGLASAANEMVHKSIYGEKPPGGTP